MNQAMARFMTSGRIASRYGWAVLAVLSCALSGTSLAAVAKSAPAARASSVPAGVAAIAAASSTPVGLSPQAKWVNVTNNVGGDKWGPGGVLVVAAVPARPEMVAAVSEAGLWFSGDGGAKWAALPGQPGEKVRPAEILFDPQDGKTFWVACPQGGLYKSSDAGKTFARLGDFDGAESVSVNLDDADRKLLLAPLSAKGGLLMKSIDGGKTWQNIGAALPANLNPCNHAIILDDKTYLVSAAGPKVTLGSGIFRTEDGGTIWRKVSDLAVTGKPLRLADGTVYWSQIWSQGLIRSTDNGRTWTPLDVPVKKTPIELPQGRLVAVADRQLLASDDAGATWSPLGSKLPQSPSGIIFNHGRNCLVAWLSTPQRVDNAIWRLDLP